MQTNIPTVPAARFAAVGKRYGPVTALDGVDFEIRAADHRLVLGDQHPDVSRGGVQGPAPL